MKKQLESGFTLIELMIVIAIIGILAAVGIPAYQDYIGRAQASEGIHLASGAKSPLVEYYTSNGSWPTLTDVYNSSSGKYTASLAGATTSGAAGTYTVTATMTTTGVTADLASKTLRVWTTDGGASWSCGAGSASPVPTRFLPSSCRAS